MENPFLHRNLQICNMERPCGCPPFVCNIDLLVQCLADCRDKISKELGINAEDLELSMGMSGDFEPAVSIPFFIATIESAVLLVQ